MAQSHIARKMGDGYESIWTRCVVSHMVRDMRNFVVSALALCFFVTITVQAPAFEKADWSVFCWESESKLWTDRGHAEMTVELDGTDAIVTNSSEVHRHAHFVFQSPVEGDFTFIIELKGGYELGFLNRKGKDEMLYLELSDDDAAEFQTYELSRKGTRYTITRNGRVIPLVHFRFDYGDPILITLAIKQGESATIRSYRLEN